MLEVIKIIAAGYFLLLGMAAVFGRHEPLLAIPARSLYSLLRLMILVLTFGKWRMAPPARKAGYKVRRKWRGAKAAWEDWRREETDEEIIYGWGARSKSEADDSVKGA